MKIALVHDFYITHGGGEAVLKEFAKIWPDAPIYMIAHDPAVTENHLPNRKIISSFLQNWPGMPKIYKWLLPFMPKAIESFNLQDFDVVLSDSSAYAKGVITAPSTTHICYLHTPTRYLWSDRETYLKSAPIPRLLRPLLPLLIKYLQRWDLKASKRPDVIIANSQFIAKRTKQYYHRIVDKVVFPPVDCSRFYIADKLSDYWLVVARQEPYKRTDLAIMAANQLGFKLKVVGAGTKLKSLTQLAGPTVEFVGRVSDSELSKLYAEAIGFIFPPLEDAGITPLEAMASGRPVIAYGQGGALESVVPGVTGEFFAEQTLDSLVKVLSQFRPEAYNSQMIRKHAEQFDSKLFRQQIKLLVEKLAKSSS